jgi:hypothetical protein
MVQGAGAGLLKNTNTVAVATECDKQDWKFFHSLSREKKMSKLSKILFLQFLTCNSWLAILDLQFLTCNSWLVILDLQFLTCNSWLAILDLQFLTCNSWQNVPREGTKCALARHKKIFRLMCHVGRHKMCHRTAQKVLCATGRYKMCHSTAQKDF